MGAWGPGPFDNDDAGDWVYSLEADGVTAIAAAIDLDENHPEAPAASEAVAAAAVVGLAHGLTVESIEEVDDWVAGADTDTVAAFAPAAAVALDRVLGGSELAELHDEAGNDDWRQQVAALRDGLRG
jgi:hypothetical protein